MPPSIFLILSLLLASTSGQAPTTPGSSVPGSSAPGSSATAPGPAPLYNFVPYNVWYRRMYGSGQAPVPSPEPVAGAVTAAEEAQYFDTSGQAPVPSPEPVAQGAANGDPHLMLAHGGKADFRGTDKGLYNFLSAKNLSLNVMTELADFYLHDTDHPRHKLVHGSFLTQAHVVALTGGGRTVHASYWASKIGPLNIGWINATIDNQQAFSLGPHTTKVVDDVSLHMDYSSLHVTTGEWELAVTPQAVERSVAGPVRRIDVQMTPRVAESKFSVPPHGVIGQSWDGDNKAVFGEEDEFPVRGEYTTSAMAEGAIEGVPTDYLMSSPYATDFKYSRFGLSHASPRDVSKLTGRVWAAVPLAGNGAGVMEKEMELSAGQVS